MLFGIGFYSEFWQKFCIKIWRMEPLGWTFEYVSGVNIFQGLIFFSAEYFSEVNIFRGEYMSFAQFTWSSFFCISRPLLVFHQALQHCFSNDFSFDFPEDLFSSVYLRFLRRSWMRWLHLSSKHKHQHHHHQHRHKYYHHHPILSLFTLIRINFKAEPPIKGFDDLTFLQNKKSEG